MAGEVAAEFRRRLATGESAPEDQLPAQEFRRLREVGLLAAPLARGLGGGGLGVDPGSTAALLRVLKRVGSGNLAVGRVYEGHVNALQLIATFATPTQRRRFAAEVREAGSWFGVWNAADPAEDVTVEPRGRDRFRLHGKKVFCSGVGWVNRPFVNGRLPDGRVQMCVVPMEPLADRVNLDWWRPLGMRASVSGQVDFEGVEVGADQLIGAPDDYHRDPWFRAGAVRFASVQLGGADALYDAVRDSLAAHGRPDDPHQQRRAAEMAADVESGRLWLGGAAEAWDQAVAAAAHRVAGGGADLPGVSSASPPPGPGPGPGPGDAVTRATAYAGAMRLAVEEICLRVIRRAEQAAGARGLIQPCPVERWVRDLTMYLRQPAPDAVATHLGRHVLAHRVAADQQWDEPLA